MCHNSAKWECTYFTLRCYGCGRFQGGFLVKTCSECPADTLRTLIMRLPGASPMQTGALALKRSELLMVVTSK